MNRTKFLGTIFAFSMLLLAVPSIASAQYRSDDDNYRTNRGGRNTDNYNRRFLVDAVRRVEDNSRSFRRALDRELDNTRYDSTRREDRINDVTERFATAADNLEDAFDNGNNINSSSDEAQLVFQLASQIDRFMSRNQFGGNVENQWSNIRRDLQTISSTYGYGSNGSNRRNNDDDYDRRDRSNNRRNSNQRGNRNNRFPY